MRKAGHLVEELLHGGEAAAAVPGGVAEARLVEVAQKGHAAVAVAQVGRADGAPARVVGGLGVRPLGPGVQELERVVVEARGQRQAAREVARPQQEERLGARDLVDVGHEDDVAVDGGGAAGQLGEDLVVHGVALQILIVPGPLGVEVGREVELVVDHLVVEAAEALPAGEHRQRLVVALERLGRLDNDKVVDVVVEGLEADLHPVQLRVDHEEVVDLALARLRLGREDGVAVGVAKGPGLGRGVVVARRGGEVEVRGQLLAQDEVEVGDAAALGVRGQERLAEEPVGEAEEAGDEDERSNPGGHDCGCYLISLLGGRAVGRDGEERREAVGERELSERERERDGEREIGIGCVGSPDYDGQKNASHRDRRVE